ncbi:MAG TPA: dihydrolipoyl dehydrogenase [Planctomycetota bacterium]|nr:dihydrolipoyl dehydrogenase [Planctomycetota bacterium]
MSAKAYDVVVLGGGPGGYVAAIRAAQLGMKTAVVEKDNLGGICLNWGCIPTKALLKNAEYAWLARKEGEEWGLHFDNLRIDFARVIQRSRDVSSRIVKGVEFLMKKNKIDVLKGPGRIAAKDKLEYGKEAVQFKNLILATGGRPRPFPGVPFDGKKVISYFEAMVPKELPKKLVIIGGGAIGCEFAYFYNAFGTEVTLIELLDSLLPNEDKEVTKELAKSFKKIGIKVMTGVKAGLKVTEKGVRVSAGEGEIDADQCLVAIGIQGNTEDLGLEELKIATDKGFIKTDDRDKTNVPNIRAIGDVNGKVLLAHVASHQGVVACEDIAGVARHGVDYTSIPSCTYCQPQVASVGLTEEKCKSKGLEVKIGRYPFRPHGKAVATGENEGFVKLIFGAKYGELLGAHILGSEATEMIAEACAAKTSEATMFSLAETIHAHPTMAEAFHEATLDALGRAIHL